MNNIKMLIVEITKNAAKPVFVLLAKATNDSKILFSENAEIKNITKAKNNNVSMNDELNFISLEFNLFPILRKPNM